MSSLSALFRIRAYNTTMGSKLVAIRIRHSLILKTMICLLCHFVQRNMFSMAVKEGEILNFFMKRFVCQFVELRFTNCLMMSMLVIKLDLRM